MLSIAKENKIKFNAEYLENQETIDLIQQRLQSKIEALDLNSSDHKDAIHYSNDRVTLFRFLKDCAFSIEDTLTRLLDTIQWRLENQIGRMTYQSIASEFFDEAFAFFYKQDFLGRPVAVIQMRHFPKFQDKSKSLTEFMQPFACFVMEVARQITRDLTRENEARQQQPVLISQISIIIDIAKAPFVPIDSSLMQALKSITNTRFPGFLGSVYIMNFGWMYQGIWQVVKLVLSEQAKARVNFVNSNEIKQIVDENDLLKALGGKDEYQWSLESDQMLELYATEARFSDMVTAEQQPVLRSQLSRSSSVSSLESNVFFDAVEYPSDNNSTSSTRRQSYYRSPQHEIIQTTFTSTSPSVYGTPGSLTPIGNYNHQLALVRPTSEPRYFLNGFHMGESFMTSFFRIAGGDNSGINTPVDGNLLASRLNELALQNELGFSQELVLQEDESNNDVLLLKRPSNDITAIHFPHMLPNNHPSSIYLSSPFKHQLIRAEQKILRLTRKLFHLSFAYKGAMYWVMLYIFLRGPVEDNLRKTLTKLLHEHTNSQRIAIGITATIAAGLSASFANSLSNTEHHHEDRRRRP